MKWIASTQCAPDVAGLEKRLWETADRLRANTGPKALQYSGRILGLKVRVSLVRCRLESLLPGVEAAVRGPYGPPIQFSDRWPWLEDAV